MLQPATSIRPRHRVAASLLLRRALLPSMIAGMVGVAQAQDPSPAPAPAPAAPAATQELDSVQVRGVRGSATGAVDAKQAKAEISDSVVAEDIGKLPDNSVAAALQRVTGVQVARGGAEVGTVLVRGLPDVVTTFDGRNVFTASGRGIALQDIPADLLQSVDVYKTGSAKFLEGGIGGSIDVHLRKPFDLDKDTTLAGSISAVQGDQAGETKPNGSLTAAHNWDSGHGRMGVLGSISLQQRPYQESNSFHGTYDRVANPADPSQEIFVPYNAGGLVANNTHKRRSANFTFQWAPTDNSEVYLDTFYVNYEGRNNVNYWMPFPGLVNADNVDTVSLRPGSNVMDGFVARDLYTLSSTQAHKQTSDTFQAALGGKWHNDTVSLSTELAYTWSTNKHRAMTLDMGMDAPLMHMRDAGGVPDTWVTQADGSAYDVTNPANWYLSQYYDSWDEQKGEEWAWRGDSTFQFDAGPFSSLDAGLRLSRRTASNHGGGPGAMDNISGRRVLASDVPGLAAVSPGGMLDGARAFSTDRWAVANAAYLLQQTAQLRQVMGQSPDAPPELASLFFDNREDNYAAYLQLNWGTTLGSIPVDGRIGVRATRLESELSGTRSVDGVDVPSQIETSQTRFLPNASANVSLREDLILRLSGSQTIARPNFADLNPQLSLYESTDSLPARGNGGNPDLQAVESKNLDASLEWYFQPGSLLSAAVFHRRLDGYVQSYADDEVIAGTTYSITRPRNTGQGTLKGFEVGYSQFYDFLPGWLSGFGTQLNYTRISAEAESPTGQLQPLTNVSKHAFNAVLMYQYERFSARLAWNRRTDYATSFNSSGDQPSDIRQGDEDWLDVALNYDINEHITVFAEATNLLGGSTRNYFGSPAFPRDFASPERTYTVGARFRL